MQERVTATRRGRPTRLTDQWVVLVVPDVELPVVPVVPELDVVPEVVSEVVPELVLDGVLVLDEPLAPMPLVVELLLPGVTVVVLVLAVGETVVELSRPDVRVVVVDEQPAASAAAAARATIENERCMGVMGLPC